MESTINLLISEHSKLNAVTVARILAENADQLPGLHIQQQQASRGIDPTIAVALITGVTSVITTLIPNLIKVWSKDNPRPGKVAIRLDDGSAREFATGPGAATQATVVAEVTESLKQRKIISIEIT